MFTGIKRLSLQGLGLKEDNGTEYLAKSIAHPSLQVLSLKGMAASKGIMSEILENLSML